MKVLVIDDDPTVRQRLRLTLDTLGHEGQAVAAFKDLDGWTNEALAAYDAAIIDKKLEDEDGLDFGPSLFRRNPRIQLIMLTGHGSTADAVAAMRRGFFDFLSKPSTVDEIRAVLTRVEECADRIRRLVPTTTSIVGRSAGLDETIAMAVKAAQTNATVLVTGETGTGKELLAQLIHDCSPRRARPFVKLNCGGLADTLLETELFGHVRGAFTGAAGPRRGRFELADKGTLFLDEIGEMGMAAQVKLLRVLQEKEFEKLGDERTTRVDVRFISATNRALDEQVASGAFREDLLYRINVITITMPPLRDRPGDVRLLANTFLKKFADETRKVIAGISEDALQKLVSYSWPGNVRELQNVIERAVTLHGGSTALRVEDLPPHMQRPSSTTVSSTSGVDGSQEGRAKKQPPSATDPDGPVETSAALAAWLADQIVRSEATNAQQSRVDYPKSIFVIKAELLGLSQRGRLRPGNVAMKEFFDRAWPLLDDRFELKGLKWMTGESKIMSAKGPATIARLTKLALEAFD